MRYLSIKNNGGVTRPCRLKRCGPSRGPLLGILDEGARQELVEAGRVQTAEKDTVLFFAGDPTHDILVLLHGQVRLWRLTQSGHELVLRVCEPGEVLGQMSATCAGCHSIGATAASRSRLLRLPAVRFRELVAARAASPATSRGTRGAPESDLQGDRSWPVLHELGWQAVAR